MQIMNVIGENSVVRCNYYSGADILATKNIDLR